MFLSGPGTGGRVLRGQGGGGKAELQVSPAPAGPGPLGFIWITRVMLYVKVRPLGHLLAGPE